MLIDEMRAAAAAIEAGTYRIDSEAALSRDILTRLRAVHSAAWIAEHAASTTCRLDLYLPPLRIGIEIKMRWQLAPLVAQAQRYLRLDAVDGLVVAAPRRPSLPASLEGKPVVCVSLACGVLR